MRLLSSARLGRVGMCPEGRPQVLPVTYTVVDGQLMFRTTLYSVLASGTDGATVAFQVDELDDRLRSGWSVLVVGAAQHLDDPKEMAEMFARMDEPWAPGTRPRVVRIVPAEVTGRRFRRT
jgi:nitroimidazol reductase NimA-like FMN-containing flavoprotein (pyridoxamine 5'-phosphate oxidase superfamily)